MEIYVVIVTYGEIEMPTMSDERSICPHCGAKGTLIWEEDDYGDYLGDDTCIKCGMSPSKYLEDW